MRTHITRRLKRLFSQANELRIRQYWHNEHIRQDLTAHFPGTETFSRIHTTSLLDDEDDSSPACKWLGYADEALGVLQGANYEAFKACISLAGAGKNNTFAFVFQRDRRRSFGEGVRQAITDEMQFKDAIALKLTDRQGRDLPLIPVVYSVGGIEDDIDYRKDPLARPGVGECPSILWRAHTLASKPDTKS